MNMHVAYCLNGHYVGVVDQTLHPRSWGQAQALMAQSEERQSHSPPPFCAVCGAESIRTCQHCKSKIIVRSSGTPGYCGGCGRPFPWTETALTAAKEYTDALDQLSPEEKTALKETFDEIGN